MLFVLDWNHMGKKSDQFMQMEIKLRMLAIDFSINNPSKTWLLIGISDCGYESGIAIYNKDFVKYTVW